MGHLRISMFDTVLEPFMAFGSVAEFNASDSRMGNATVVAQL